MKSLSDEFWSIKSSKKRKRWLQKINSYVEDANEHIWYIQECILPQPNDEEPAWDPKDLLKMPSKLALQTTVDNFKACMIRMRQIQLAFGIDDIDDDCDEMDTSDDDKMDDAGDADDKEEGEEDTAMTSSLPQPHLHPALSPTTSPSPAPGDLSVQLAQLKLQCSGASQQIKERDSALQHCTQIIQRLEDEAAGLQKELLLRIRELQQVVRERDALKADAEKPLW